MVFIIASKVQPQQNVPSVKTLGLDRRLDITLNLLKLIGNSPLSCEGTNSYRYYFLKWTPSTIISLIVAVYFIFAHFIVLSHAGLRKYFLFGKRIRRTFDSFETILMLDERMSKANVESITVALTALFVILTSFSILNIVLAWVTSSKLANYLNNWQLIQAQFSRTFARREQRPVKNLKFPLETKRKGWSEIKIFNVGLCLYVLAAGFFQIIMLSVTFDAETSIEEMVIMFSTFFHFGVCETLEDVKNVLIYLSLKDAFKAIRLSIQEELTWGKISERNVQAWRQLIKQVQSQCELAGNCLMPIQLSFLLSILLAGTLLVHIFLNGFGASPLSMMFAAFGGGFCCFMFGRLYFKVLIAEKVGKEEGSIADELMRMNSADCTSSVLAQIRMTYDTLTQNPSEINLGNYVTMNKGLFLSILGQVITYLIVLMQFFQVNPPTI